MVPQRKLGFLAAFAVRGRTTDELVCGAGEASGGTADELAGAEGCKIGADAGGGGDRYRNHAATITLRCSVVNSFRQSSSE
jgi:hypothetical protein